PDDMKLWDKVRTIAREVYRADDITADQTVRARFEELEKEGAGSYPVCMAKTQYSFSADASLRGAPTGFTVPIRELRLSGGAEFVVAICGNVMTMPGLPRVPAANAINVESDGRITGLF
ncbi:MAG: formate--tetrahydrofolate ligase, partial [Proteobacteria bacterium]|nr:formate--tetrahydrofolate ligase [Pseudomonadota bacterium]